MMVADSIRSFGTQANLFDGRQPVIAEPSRDEVLGRLHALLSIAQEATRMPWDEQRSRVNALLFYNMANWLPEEERASLRAAFSHELERLRVTSGSKA